MNLTDYTLPGEEWREVAGFPNFLVSNYGRVWNTRKEKPVPMQKSQWRTVEAKPRRTMRAYLRVQLYGRDSEGKAITKGAVVHRLVAAAFIPNDDPEHKTIVDHIDNDPYNNMACNLQWVTNGQNLKNAQTEEQSYTRWLIQNLKKEKIDETKKTYRVLRIYQCRSELSEENKKASSPPLPEEIEIFDNREDAEKLAKSFNDFFDDSIKFYSKYTFSHVVEEC